MGWWVGGLLFRVLPLLWFTTSVRQPPTQPLSLALDCEWDTYKGRHGHFERGSSEAHVSVVQLAYWDPDEERAKALVLQLGNSKTLPSELKTLFSLGGSSKFTFVGRCVAQDLKKLGRDFKCVPLMAKVDSLDLGRMAKSRGVVARADHELAKIVAVTLKRHLAKSPSVRLSEWSAATLSPEQQQYAAMDVVEALKVYRHLDGLPDLSARITCSAATTGVVVDVVPAHGDVTIFSTRAATGTIVELEGGVWTNTLAQSKPKTLKAKTNWRLVELSSVRAPAAAIKHLKYADKRPVTLGAFQPGDRIYLPVTMLAPHHDVPPPQELPTDMAGPTGLSAGAEGEAVEDVEAQADAEAAAQALDEEVFNATAGPDGEEGWEDAEAAPLTSREVREVMTATDRAVASAVKAVGQPGHKWLDDPPEEITDCFSSVLGDSFHYMQRPYVSDV